MKPKKAQIWTTDLVVALVLFLSVILFFYKYTYNISESKSGKSGDLAVEAKIITNSILSEGFPQGWNTTNVIRIGVLTDKKIDENKIFLFSKIPYAQTKSIFGITSNYYIFFQNSTGGIRTFSGICGIGSPNVQVNVSINSALYYDDTPSYTSVLQNLMKNTYRSKIYCYSGVGCDGDNVAFRSALTTTPFELLVMERSILGGPDLNNPDGILWKINESVKNGTYILFDKAFVAPEQRIFLGINFTRKCGYGTSCPQNATVNFSDPYFTFEKGELLEIDISSDINFTPIAQKPVSIARYIPPETYVMQGRPALARWNFGKGKVIYAADFFSNYKGQTDIVPQVEQTINKLFAERCKGIFPPNATRLLKIDRFVVADKINFSESGFIESSEILKMVIYVWK